MHHGDKWTLKHYASLAGLVLPPNYLILSLCGYFMSFSLSVQLLLLSHCELIVNVPPGATITCVLSAAMS